MIIHDLKQGTPEWHQFRLNHFGASEAAAMLGLSSKVTRNELLHMKHTGTAKEYSEWVEKNLFEKGHEVEALARPIIEDVIDDELYPVTCSDGSLSASCDGLTLDNPVAFEHKIYNVSLASYMALEGTVPDEYMPQCQQIMMVTGAEKVIFVTSDGTLKKHSRIEVLANSEWQEKIRAGWIQFEKDLSEYKPRDLPEKPESSAIMELPALSIQIKGEVIASNLPAFKSDAETFIANINTELKTDEDFANAEATVKFCSETEKKLELAKDAAIAQTSSIDEVMRTIDFIKEELRKKRLNLDKKVKSEKEKIKSTIIQEAKKLFEDHFDRLNKEFKGYVILNAEQPNFATAMKNKRTLESLHNAADTELARCKILADQAAQHIRNNLAVFHEQAKDHRQLFRDIQTIIYKDKDDFELIVKTRISDHEKSVAEAAQKKIEDVKKAEEPKKQNIGLTLPNEQSTQTLGANVKASFAFDNKTNPDKELVTISKKEYLILKNDSSLLHYLINYGVDNWNGYDDAISEYEQLKQTS